MEWAQEYARALARAAGRDVTVSPDEQEAVLLLARLVAHGSERRNAPLATFLAGQLVSLRREAGVPVGEAIGEATRLAEELLPESAEDEDEGRPAG
jgi:hypothetical protein